MIRKVENWMIIDSVRYAMGRRTGQVGTTFDWLIAHWDDIDENTRGIVENDVEGEIAVDDRMRADDTEQRYLPLGHDMDRAKWDRVRAVWVDRSKEGVGRD